ncbi:PqqD family protein [Cohnella thailandensis]|uniref:PqqD family protein n=1 Tax=Cohnella thailandensis TaxID=557557 RepID=A0A841T1Z5_9BACL|nr:PqqD family protein [Cohnella thailandensis]MBB6635101.1 PqqD family protein [Cohnella thailandensis]MBP1974434.1 hypothetical protein [Cohnella thailandensis]
MKLERLQSVEMLELDGEIILLNQETLAVTKLNGSASWIWEQLSSSLTQEELVERMAAEYEGADIGRIGSDIASFVEQMTGIGLIRNAG